MAKSNTTSFRQTDNKKYLLVRYGRMNNLGFFRYEPKNIPRLPTRVVVKTEKGLEIGELIGWLAANKPGRFRLSNTQVKQYFDNSQIEFDQRPAGKIIRPATTSDLSEQRHLQQIAQKEMEYCAKLAKEMNLPMKVVDVEHIFGGERIIFYFMSDSRVDFRELVKKLASEYQSRIEMRQIGSRDEAKLLGDVESCGQVCCCIRFLRALKPVNMKMAKMQKATLDPAKISGYCGRLKCCLRYEDSTYTELKKRLPKKRTVVKTRYGQGKVVDTQILTQLVVIELEDSRRIALPLEETEIISAPETRKKKTDSKNEDEQKTQSRQVAQPEIQQQKPDQKQSDNITESPQ